MTATFAFPRPVRAQTADSAAAETLFRDGKRFLEQKDFPRACPKLAESFRLDPATGTLLALAMCHEGLGRTATAWAEYTDAAARAKREGRPDREQAAVEWAAALEVKLSTLTIAVPDALAKSPGLAVKRDGVVIGAGTWGTPVPVDPGDHVVEAVAAGKKAWSKTVAVRASGDKQRVEVGPLEELPVNVRPAESPRRSLTPLQQTGLVGAGIGLLATGAGAYFGIDAMQKNKRSNLLGCNENYCPLGPATQARSEAVSAGNISAAAFIAGGTLVAAGAVLFFVGASDAPSRAGIRAVPVVGATQVGVGVAGPF